MSADQQNDLEEFMATATAASAREEDVANSHIAKAPPLGDPDDDDDQKIGKLTQYARVGQGFAPTTATVATLPPGMYHIEATNQAVWFEPHKLITDSLLRLPDSKSDEVIGEIEKFWKLKDTFRRFGFSYKRGFLLWGPPGSGKTSTVSFVNRELVKSGGVVILSNGTAPSLTAMMLQRLRDIEPERPCAVVLEDIDTIIRQYGEAEVLSLLDGEDSIDNVVFIATTNYPEKLDGRVVNRPSRFDRVVKIGMPSAAARGIYLKSRNIGLTDNEIDKWVSLTEGFSIAHVKELVIGVFGYGNSLEEDVKRLRSMARAPKSDDTGNRVGFGE